MRTENNNQKFLFDFKPCFNVEAEFREKIMEENLQNQQSQEIKRPQSRRVQFHESSNRCVKVILLVFIGIIALAGAFYAGIKFSEIRQERIPKEISVPNLESSISPRPTSEAEEKGGEITPLTQEEKERLRSYTVKISLSCLLPCFGSPGVSDKRKCFVECLGGEEKFRDYIKLFDRAVSIALSSRENVPLPEFVSGREMNINRIAFIKNAYEKEGRNYIDADYVQMLGDSVPDEDGINTITTLEASKACVEDGECSREWCHLDFRLPCMPNGYYIRNNDRRTKTLEVSNSAIIESLKGVDLEEITFTELKGKKEPLCDIRIENNGLVIRISEVFRP